MPNYEYKCMLCNENMIVKKSIEERDDEIKCLKCGNPANRVYHSVNAVFKGGGFYSTDNPKERRK